VWLFVIDTGLVSQWIFSPDNGERLMLVPRAADGFKARVSKLRSLDGMSFHTFSLPKDRYLRLMGKIRGRQMPEEVVGEELENLGLCPGSLAAQLRAP
jgi:Ser/Thr protein kinase RdoA (MazF antagonist)